MRPEGECKCSRKKDNKTNDETVETKGLSMVDWLIVCDDEMDEGSHRTGLEEPHNPGYRRKPRDTVLIMDTRALVLPFFTQATSQTGGWGKKEKGSTIDRRFTRSVEAPSQSRGSLAIEISTCLCILQIQ